MKVWDLHCDTLSELRYAQQENRALSFADNDTLHISLDRLEQGDYMLQCLAAFMYIGKERGDDPMTAALEEIDIFHRIMEQYADRIAPVYTAADIDKNAAAGKISAMLTVEEGACCKGSLGALRMLHRLGVRMMTLTWNFENELAWPNMVPDGKGGFTAGANTTGGLKARGLEFLAEMERLHITADVSHLSDKGFWDIVEHSTRPFAASHSNCRALAPHPRNLTDEMIRAMADRGCIAGLNLCAGFLDGDPVDGRCRSTAALMAKHAAHFKQVGGVEMIALGSDFDGIGGELEISDCTKMQLLVAALKAEGFTDDEVEAVFYGNALRFFRGNL